MAPDPSLPLRTGRRTAPALATACLPLLLGACGLGRWLENGFKVGPEYAQPGAEVADEWIDYQEPGLVRDEADLSQWWQVFEDPVLARLIAEARQQNLGLQASLARVAEVAARLGIAKGEFWPQSQAIEGAFSRNKFSGAGNFPIADQWASSWSLGVSIGWELDLWGRYRRSIEAAEADLQATQADYDDAVVLLLGEVAATYMRYRTFQERLAAAQRNTAIQQANYELAVLRRDAGAVSDRDVEQAKQVLEQTRARIPVLELGLREANNALCVLRGAPVRDLADELGREGTIPTLPAQVAIGVPADLLRRRPDIRSAERQLAAQSARIGVAESDLFPHLSLFGGLGVEAAASGDLFDTPTSLVGFIGPSFRWDVLNYGRFENNIEAQQQRFEQLIQRYRAAVLQADREAEDSIAAFLFSQRAAASLQQSRDAADRALQITLDQYREGAVDFTAVFLFAGTLADQDDALASARGSIALGLVALYRSLGGGWQLPVAPAGTTAP
ncbi:MAG: efflux transporter outer membrane subunit [Planctomycetes bacterium]|nr:efflux transporter outer membrane subunit [Planctomycetota bacterium]